MGRNLPSSLKNQLKKKKKRKRKEERKVGKKEGREERRKKNVCGFKFSLHLIKCFTMVHVLSSKLDYTDLARQKHLIFFLRIHFSPPYLWVPHL